MRDSQRLLTRLVTRSAIRKQQPAHVSDPHIVHSLACSICSGGRHLDESRFANAARVA